MSNRCDDLLKSAAPSRLPVLPLSRNGAAMCARRFLIAIFVLTLLAVAGAFAIFQFGERCWPAPRPRTAISSRRRREAVPIMPSPPTGSPGRSIADNPSRLAARRRTASAGATAARARSSSSTRPPISSATAGTPARRRRQPRPRRIVRAQPGERVQRRRARSGRRATARRPSAPSCSTARMPPQALDLAYGDVARAFDAFLAATGRHARSSSPRTARARCT